MDRFVIFLLIALSSTIKANSLFFEDGQYIYTFKAIVSTGTIQPNYLMSSHGIRGNIGIQKSSSSSVLVKLSSLRHTLFSADNPDYTEGSYKIIPHQAHILEKSFLINFNSDGIIDNLKFTNSDPLWSMNMKKAIAVSFQMQLAGRQLPGAYKSVLEPCLHGLCLVEYSSSDGVRIRKSNNVETLTPSSTHDLWMSVMPNICAKDTKNPLIGTANRWYTLDERGILNMVSEGNIEIHYHNHVFQSLTNLTIERTEIVNEILADKETHMVQSRVAFEPPPRNEPTGGRAPINPDNQLEMLWEILGRLADGLEHSGLTDTLLKDKLTLRLQNLMSMLSYETLDKAHRDLQLGTSYKWETMKNIFLEVLPQATSRPSVLLIRDLIVNRKLVDKRMIDEKAILQMLKKFPFNVADLSQNLLTEMEPLLKLSLQHSEEVRHTAILSFANLVFKTFIISACTTDVFEHYVQTFFSRFTESPDYADRLVWLSALSNLQMEHVGKYLSPVIAGTLGHSTHERFLAVWATMPLAHLYPTDMHNIYWPILHNNAEPLEMRAAALTMLILAEPSPHRLMSLYWYITSQKSEYLKHFFYTTIKSLEKTTYDCYKYTGKLASYIAKVIKPPENQSKLWGTGNYLLDVADVARDMGYMTQLLTISNPLTGLPDVFYFTITSHNAGLVVQDYAIYLKLQGLASNVINKLHRMNGESLHLESLAAMLKKLKVPTQTIQPVHIEILLKYQGKIIYSRHFNQTNFDANFLPKRKIYDFFQSDRHINQQILVYPTILKSTLSSEIGTPIITDTILSSLTSIRGNLTHSQDNEELTRKNDVYFRTSSLALIGLAAYNPIADTHHLGEVAQVSDAYFPANFTIALALTKQLIRTSWLSSGSGQTPGFVAYSGSRVAVTPKKDIAWKDFCASCPLEMFNNGSQTISKFYDGFNLKCDNSITWSELFWELISSHKSNTNVLPAAKPFFVILHTFVLAITPAEGLCKISITSPFSRENPERLDAEISIPLNLDFFDKHQFTIGSVRKIDDEKQTILSIFNSTVGLEWVDNKIRVIMKATGKNSPDSNEWKLCFDAEEKYIDDTELQDLESRGTLKEGHISVAFGDSTNKCPTNGTMVVVNVNLSNMNITDDTYDIQLRIKNLPTEITSLSSKYSNALGLFDPSKSFHTAKIIFDEFMKPSVSLNINMMLDRQNSLMILKTDNETTVNSWKTDYFNWLVNPKGYVHVLKRVGILRECRLKSGVIIDVNDKRIELGGNKNCELLAVGDCTNIPKFAIMRLPSPHGLALKMYTGGNYAEIQPTPSGELKVVVNDHEVNWQPIYRFPEDEQFSDFVISGSGNKLKIASKLSDITIIYRLQEAIILLPTTHLSMSCGVCLQSQTLYTKC